MEEKPINYTKALVTPVIFSEANLTKDFINVKQDEKLKYLSRDEVRDVLATIDAPKEKLLFLFMWMTGCRVTEVVSVLKRDLDYQNSEVKIRWLKNRKYLYRTMPLHPQLKQMLELTMHGKKMDERLFPYSRQRVWQIVKKHFPSWVHPHTLRHSFAVNYLRQADSPNDLVILRKLMGHSSILTTMGYLDIVPRDQAIQLAKIKF